MDKTLTTKVCTKCGAAKATDQFYLHAQNKGLHPWCKRCHYESSKKRKAATKERTRQTSAAYRERKRDHIRAVKKTWRDANPERTKAQRLKDANHEIRTLSATYVTRQLGLTVSEAPIELIEAKRIQLKIKRYLKNGN